MIFHPFHIIQSQVGQEVAANCDPFVICYSKNDGEEKKEIGRTEIIRNNVNPTFRDKFTLRYQFEVKTRKLFFFFARLNTVSVGKSSLISSSV